VRGYHVSEHLAKHKWHTTGPAQEPCSIASVTSLLAGSDLLKLVPPGTEFLSDQQMKEQGTFKNLSFSLGWWDEAHRFGIDVGIADRHSPPGLAHGVAEHGEHQGDETVKERLIRRSGRTDNGSARGLATFVDSP
jgi:hypothetical protein